MYAGDHSLRDVERDWWRFTIAVVALLAGLGAAISVLVVLGVLAAAR